MKVVVIVAMLALPFIAMGILMHAANREYRRRERELNDLEKRLLG